MLTVVTFAHNLRDREGGICEFLYIRTDNHDGKHNIPRIDKSHANNTARILLISTWMVD